MGMEENGGAAKCILSGWSAAARPCDWCKAAAALLFCRPDKAFMCMACDAKAHGACRHERVWMCEVCEQAPASVTCKADAAALCVTCDHDIHSANPLARRHERVPVVPFFDTADSVVKSAASFLIPACDHHPDTTTGGLSDVEAPHASWILSNPNPSKLPGDDPDMKSFELIFSEPDHFLDLDSVVPVQPVKPLPPPQLIEHFPESRFEIDFNRSNLNSYSSSYTQSVSSSSMDVGVVPDGTSMSDISYPFALHLNSSVDPSGSTNGNQAPQLSGSDREARVMRYREKRKNRKFEKTIRYASRKAYAETRPRIKGRFAKRPETDPDVDHWLAAGSTAFMGGDPSGYGVVPSF